MASPSLYPAPKKNDRPWWAKKVAKKHTKDVFGWLSALLLVVSVAYGVWKINEQTFLPAHKDAKALIGTADGDKLAGDRLQVPGQEGSKRLTTDGALKVSLLVFWIVGPPIWFWLEYVGLYRYEDASTREPLEQFKYTQEVASKIWLALITALTILYFGKDLHG